MLFLNSLHFRPWDHLSQKKLIWFRHRIISVSLRFLYFRESRTGLSQDFLFWAVWRKVKAQSNVTSSSCLLQSFLISARLFYLYNIRLSWLDDIRPRKFSWSHVQSTVYVLHVDTPSSSMTPTQFTRHLRRGFYDLCILATGAFPHMLPM